MPGLGRDGVASVESVAEGSGSLPPQAPACACLVSSLLLSGQPLSGVENASRGAASVRRVRLMQVGVVEAIKSALGQLPQQSVTLRYLLSAAGDISVSDVDLAAASEGLVLGFNLQPDTVVEEHAKRLGVKIMTYKVRGDDARPGWANSARVVAGEAGPLGRAAGASSPACRWQRRRLARQAWHCAGAMQAWRGAGEWWMLTRCARAWLRAVAGDLRPD